MTDTPIGNGSSRFVTMDSYVISPTSKIQLVSRLAGLQQGALLIVVSSGARIIGDMFNEA
jgi:hypothetical protein